MSSLVDGRIPARTECPFRVGCKIAQEGACRHKGVNHAREFSCATARGFDLGRGREKREEKIFLRYPPAGSKYRDNVYQSSHDAEKFVALDTASGGYPYGTTIDNAHDFKTVEAALEYASTMRSFFEVCRVRISYDISRVN